MIPDCIGRHLSRLVIGPLRAAWLMATAPWWRGVSEPEVTLIKYAPSSACEHSFVMTDTPEVSSNGTAKKPNRRLRLIIVVPVGFHRCSHRCLYANSLLRSAKLEAFVKYKTGAISKVK